MKMKQTKTKTKNEKKNRKPGLSLLGECRVYRISPLERRQRNRCGLLQKRGRSRFSLNRN
jgi:hypothetical protein